LVLEIEMHRLTLHPRTDASRCPRERDALGHEEDRQASKKLLTRHEEGPTEPRLRRVLQAPGESVQAPEGFEEFRLQVMYGGRDGCELLRVLADHGISNHRPDSLLVPE
jgi:hypothetical protein